MTKSIERVLVIDWETTGLRNWRDPSPAYYKGPQGIQLGAAIVEPENDWKTIGEFKSNVKWLGVDWPALTWAETAYNVHKISMEELIKAPHPFEVTSLFVEFLKEHVDIDKSIRLAGHGVDFDKYFLIQLFYLAGSLQDIPIHFNHRELDTRTIGQFLWGTSSSDILYHRVLGVENREVHDALEDVQLTIELFKAAKLKIDTIAEPTE